MAKKFYTIEEVRKELAKPRDPESIYARTPQLMKELEKLVNREIRQESRKHAMSILKKCTGKTIMEFLFFAISGNGNLACMCLDFAFDKNGKHLKNKSFGSWFSPEEELELERNYKIKNSNLEL